MITCTAAPLESPTGDLRALYVSLNSPVVNIDSLPVGPASAIVAVHTNLLGATLALCSGRSSTLAFYTSSPPAPGEGAGAATDAVLSFAEGLGFLFDDDEITGCREVRRHRF